MRPGISIIIPLYNAAPYVERCLDSLAAQTYTDFEILIVDDNSTDTSAAICRRYAASDSRIRLLDTGGVNLGCGGARNVALDVAQGDFITFVDADDILPPYTLQRLKEMLDAYPQAEMATGAMVRFSGDDLPAPDTAVKEHTSVVTGPQAALTILYRQGTDRGLENSANEKLYRAHVFRQARFQPCISYEDLELIPRLVAGMEQVVSTTLPVYYYRMVENSITGRFDSRRLRVTAICLFLRRTFRDAGLVELQRGAEDRLFAAAFNMWLLTMGDERYAADHARCGRLMRLLRGATISDSRSRRKNRIGAAAAFFPGTGMLERMLRHMPGLLRRLTARH